MSSLVFKSPDLSLPVVMTRQTAHQKYAVLLYSLH